jgi:hypothetical protein
MLVMADKHSQIKSLFHFVSYSSNAITITPLARLQSSGSKRGHGPLNITSDQLKCRQCNGDDLCIAVADADGRRFDASARSCRLGFTVELEEQQR